MKKTLQALEHMLRASAHEGENLPRTQESMQSDVLQNFPVAVRKLQILVTGGPLEAGFSYHRSSVAHFGK
ncbi:MAG: hypothetical protein JNK23_00125 [Opitutaceae bacterium]|nr:hypothetical protein [Opitutaceae bacterium]